MSYLTPDDLAYIELLDTSRDAPYLIMGVSNSQFSVARHFGGITYQGVGYVYIPTTDELIRRDALALVERRRREAEKTKRADEKQRAQDAQGGLL